MRFFLRLKKNMFLEPLCLLLFILSFLISNPLDTFKGFYKILTSSAILITDYVYVGGVGGALLNVSINLLFNLVLLKILEVNMTGPIFAGLTMIIGFSFFGKNVFNTIPIYFGIWLFSKIKHKPYKNYIISLLFSSGLSPIVSYSIYGFNLPYYFSIPLGLAIGIIVGIVIPAFSSHTMSFHQGYNLYNTGFALGIISTICYGIFSLSGLNVVTKSDYDSTNYLIFYILLGGFILLCFIQANIFEKNIWKNYLNLLKSNGRLVSDYIKDYGRDAVFVNYFFNGLFFLLMLLIFKIPLNGVIFGSVIAALGFSSFGFNLKNYLPVFIGSAIAFLIKMLVRNDFNINLEMDLSIIIAIIFASGVSPIAGKYGIFYGILVGFIHISIIPIMINLQGGFDLYNNGIACGFDAAIVAVIADNFKRVFKHEKKSED